MTTFATDSAVSAVAADNEARSIRRRRPRLHAVPASGSSLGRLMSNGRPRLPNLGLPCREVLLGSTADGVPRTGPPAKLHPPTHPNYDNIGYADLSDFLYVWLRRSLQPVFPELFATVAVPKAEELVATPYRHGSKEKAETFFLDGMTQAMRRLAEQVHPAFPVTIYYAFKQTENKKGDGGTTNTGWDTFLAAVIEAGFAITGTWSMRTELGNRMIGSGTNALASSIVLVCRQRAIDAPTATRREFITELKTELPRALLLLQGLPSRDLTPLYSFLAPVSPRWTSLKPPLAPAWRSTPVTPSARYGGQAAAGARRAGFD
jgi:hypothetical protein